MTLILGVDIGLGGSVAVLTSDGGLVSINDMPYLDSGPKGRRKVNSPLLAGIIWNSHATHAFVEYVSARPGEGAVGGFTFGRALGIIEGTLAAAGITITFLTPPAWKKAVGLTLASKDAGRSEAIRRWPGHAELFARVKDDGRAEAALIAVAGIMRKGGAP
jgi:crossover junction endodeoxyribonuclease RuvC